MDEKLYRESQELALLKRFLLEKLQSYCGIKHEELKTVCAMFGIREDGDGE